MRETLYIGFGYPTLNNLLYVTNRREWIKVNYLGIDTIMWICNQSLSCLRSENIVFRKTELTETYVVVGYQSLKDTTIPFRPQRDSIWVCNVDRPYRLVT